MALSYIRPGVTVDELVTASPNTVNTEPTSICIIGPSQGFQEITEVVTLVDNHPITLSRTNPNPDTIVVKDANNPNASAFLPDNNNNDATNHDYTVDVSQLTTVGTIDISRSMQTSIAESETVTIYHENNPSPVQADGKTDAAAKLRFTNDYSLTELATGATTSSVSVQKQGNLHAAPITGTTSEADFIVTFTGIIRHIKRQVAAPVLRAFQTVYVDYTIGSTNYFDQMVQLNDTTDTVGGVIPDNATNIFVKNAPGIFTGAATLYTVAVTNTVTEQSDDYVVNGTGDIDIRVARSKGTTSIGHDEDQLSVRITYEATPKDYFLPTTLFSQSEVESKYGSSLNSSSNVLNPVSYASSVAFENGATSVTIQALFLADSPNRILTSDEAAVDIVQAWSDSLESVRVKDNINVIVPLAPSGGYVNLDDDTVLNIFSKVREHVNYMAANDEFMVAILGEDSTLTGMGSMTTLRTHATQLGALTNSESLVLIAPANFSVPSQAANQINVQVGGQYAAAAIAGMLAARPVQTTLTRKQLFTINGVNEARSEMDKNTDAQAGLLVIENKNGLIRVRHAITTNTSAVIKRELNIVRAKYFMVETIRDRLDNQAIGNIPADNRAAFTVQLMVESALEAMVSDGVVVSYKDVQARQLVNDPTQLEVRFSYLPSFPLNYISIKFSIDTTTGVIVSDQAQET